MKLLNCIIANMTLKVVTSTRGSWMHSVNWVGQLYLHSCVPLLLLKKIICSTCTWTIFEPHLEKAILCVCVSYEGTWHYLRRLTDEAQYLEIVQQGHWMWAYNINIATYASSSWTPRFHQQHHAQLPHSQTEQTMTFEKMIITLFLKYTGLHATYTW